MNKIEIDNAACIQNLEIPIDRAGWIVLRGANGSGKSTALRAVRQALGGSSPRVPVRDGQRRATVEIGAARLSVTAGQSRRKGIDELQVESIESELDISALVDPQIKDPEKADAHRLKALVKLTGAEARPDDYYDMVGGKDAYQELAVEPTDDPVLLGSRVKRALEREAREAKRKADQKEQEAKAASEIAETCGVDQAVDIEALRRVYDERLQRATELATRQKEAYRKLEERDEAKRLLDQERQSSRVSVDEAHKHQEHTKAQYESQHAKVQELKEELAKAQQELYAAETKHQQAIRQVKDSKQHADLIARLQRQVERVVEVPSDQEIESAIEAKDHAMRAIQTAERQNHALEYVRRRQDAMDAYRRYRKHADAFRDKAQSVDDVLASLIPRGPLRIEAGRLVCRTDRMKSEPYGELSDGQRWRIALDIVAQVLPPHGLVVVPQDGYQDLDPSTRQQIGEMLRERNLRALTACCDDGELRVEDE